ncbi:WD40 repeat domain-containing protein, partial [Streptomyces sp. NPDC019890]|uniref:WD40 repeat domain-containing protein n=1 Tax=Streptomyces sp. NPDC019890 TaxID=3365064 RepID=UPI003851473B
RGAAKATTTGPVILVDQFEEAFALCQDPLERSGFIDALCAAARATLPRPAGESEPLAAHVLLAVRADFFGALAAHGQLLKALQAHQIVVGPLTHDEVREAVVGPAHAEGLAVEDGLPELILSELGAPVPATASGAAAEPAYEASVLPHLAQALRASWERRTGGVLTRAAYETSGGIRWAIAAAADNAYHQLDLADRRTARLLLTRLIQSVEGRPPTRRRISCEQLLRELGAPRDAERILDLLHHARLVAVDVDPARGRETVQLIHETLLLAWPSMGQWLEEDREWIARRHQIVQAANAWHDSGNDPQRLYAGRALDDACAEAEARPEDDLGSLGWRFLRASQQQERTSLRVRVRTERVQRLLGAALALLLLAAVPAGLVLYRQERAADTHHDEDLSRRLAARSDAVRSNDPVLAGRLAVAAFRSAPTDQALSGIYASVSAPAPAPESDGDTTVLPISRTLAFHPRRPELAVQGQHDELWLWDTARHRLGAALDVPRGNWLDALAYSPDGDLLVGIGEEGVMLAWRTGPGPPRRTPVVISGAARAGVVEADLTFRPDGRTLAAATVVGRSFLPSTPASSSTRLWKVSADGSLTPGSTLTGVYAAFSPLGSAMASRHDDGALVLDGRTDGGGTTLRKPLPTAHRTEPSGLPLAFSRDGRLLAEGRAGGRVALWDVDPRNPAPRAISPAAGFPLATGTVQAVDFSLDGGTLAVAADAVALWDIHRPERPEPVGTLPQEVMPPPVALPVPTRTAVFSRTTGLLATTGKSTRLWDVHGLLRPGLAATVRMPGSAPSALALAPDAHSLAVGLRDGRIRRYSLRPNERRIRPEGELPAGSAGQAVSFLAYRKDGRALVAGRGRTTELWPPSDAGALPRRPSSIVEGTAAAYAPLSDTLLSTSAKGPVLWDLTRQPKPRRLPGLELEHGPAAGAQALSAKGNRVFVQNADSPSLYGITRGEGAKKTALPVLVWESLTRYQRFDALPRAALNAEGSLLATAAGRSLTTYRLGGHDGPSSSTALTDTVRALAFNPDGTLLAAGDDSGRVWLWRTDRDGVLSPVIDFPGGGSPVTTLELGAKDTLVAGFEDGTVIVSRLDPAVVIQRLCSTRSTEAVAAAWPRYSDDVALEEVCPSADE